MSTSKIDAKFFQYFLSVSNTIINKKHQINFLSTLYFRFLESYRRCSKRASQIESHTKYSLQQTVVSVCLSVWLSVSQSVLAEKCDKNENSFFVQLQQSEQKLSSAKKGLNLFWCKLCLVLHKRKSIWSFLF